MAKDKKNISFFDKIRYKYRLVIINDDTFEQKTSIKLSKFNIYVWVGSFVLLLVLLITSIIAFTNLKYYLPGVGKSLSFRVIGITRYGRRILQFDHDPTRHHSPIIEKLGKIIVIESKSVSEYLAQLGEMGEDPTDYAGLYGYSAGMTDSRLPIYEYPPYEFAVTKELTNLDVS